jgi:hypothetical protein
MARRPPAQIPWPLSSFPGANPQEAAGRLINCYAEPLGEAGKPTGPTPNVWRRSPGLSQIAATGQSGYRGGLIVNNLSYEVFSGQALTVTSAGAINVLGAMAGTKKVSIARNQKAAPDVVAVDVDNGAYQLSTGGAPASYNGGGNLPQPNSVAFQDGYFFFTIADGRVFASPLNALSQNSLTFITVLSKSDVALLRGIPFSGYMLFFTTGGCEVWQDAATPAPAFPYNRVLILPYGLLQSSAIAGWETGFDDLMWVGQDFGVYRLQWGQLQPTKISPPDLDRMIEAQINAGNLLEASVYAFGGKKFWCLQCPAGSWEFNLGTQRWNERFSLASNGSYGRWRATGGHSAFGRWLMGDTMSGNLLYIDDTNFSENGAVQLFRMESGPVTDFPNQKRVARADFNMVMGTGIAERNLVMTVTGAVAGTGGVVRLTVNGTGGVLTGDIGLVAGLTGTVEANGTWPLTVIDATHLEIPAVFAHAYVSGGTVTDVTSAPNVINPSVAISLSKDGGTNWGNPLIRSLGPQGRVKRQRASVKNLGQSGPIGVRWRVDVTDPVYTGLLEATMSDDPREY